jgi:ubiquitin-like-conjugating enzyme ATG10
VLYSDHAVQEALIRQSCPNPKIEVEYSIVLSPTYQVPVLYFFLRNNFPEGLEEIDFVYSHLVPKQYRTQLSKIGVMGPLSVGVCVVRNL